VAAKASTARHKPAHVRFKSRLVFAALCVMVVCMVAWRLWDDAVGGGLLDVVIGVRLLLFRSSQLSETASLLALTAPTPCGAFHLASADFQRLCEINSTLAPLIQCRANRERAAARGCGGKPRRVLGAPCVMVVCMVTGCLWGDLLSVAVCLTV